MKVYNLRTNHIKNPLGFKLDNLSLSWITKDNRSDFQEAAQVEIALDRDFNNIIFDSGKKEDIDSFSYVPDIEIQNRTRYYWRVTVWGDKGNQARSEVAWFESAKVDEAWKAKWITPDLDQDKHPLIRKTFDISGNIAKARVYMCGLGLYELEFNGKKVGDEYFTPGIN